eukprot:COSAG02_NODE_26695_length_627_cov_0.679924_1_plen_52_part_10
MLTVCPAFEVSAKFELPKEQREMLALVETGDAEGFHVGRFPSGHQPTDFQRW